MAADENSATILKTHANKRDREIHFKLQLEIFTISVELIINFYISEEDLSIGVCEKNNILQ